MYVAQQDRSRDSYAMQAPEPCDQLERLTGRRCSAPGPVPVLGVRRLARVSLRSFMSRQRS